MSSFHFIVRINSESFLCTIRSVQESRNRPKFSETSDVRYWVNQVCRCAAFCQCPTNQHRVQTTTLLLVVGCLHISRITSRSSCLQVFTCLHGFAPRYLAELCVPVADVMGRRNLRSATRGLLNFLRYNMTSYGRRAFSYAGPHAWNSLHFNRTFQALSKTFLFGQIPRSAH